jgi:hypothetical protein
VEPRALSLSALMLCLALGTAGCTGAPTLASLPERAGEHLLATPPEGWTRIYQMNLDETRISEFVPGPEDASNWTIKVSFEASASLRSAEPVEILSHQDQMDQENCRHSEFFKLSDAIENGYPTALGIYLCGKDIRTGRGELKFIKSIKGEQLAYVIRVRYKVASFAKGETIVGEDEVAAWATWLRRIKVCNSATHPCREDDVSPAPP